MKNVILLYTTFALFLLSGCHPDSEEIPEQTSSAIIVRSLSDAASTRSSLMSDVASSQVVFTGEDILWFNETTKEIRFKNNVSNINPVLGNTALSFYIDDEYLFSSMTYASSINSQIYNSLVFYYNIIENKFFLLDGYPDVSVLTNPQESQSLRDENMKKIDSEWSKFINQLKKEERYHN